MEQGLFVEQSRAVAVRRIPPGSIFLVRVTSLDWTHTGIVVEAGSETFTTLEGNTNDDGCRAGKSKGSKQRGGSLFVRCLDQALTLMELWLARDSVGARRRSDRKWRLCVARNIPKGRIRNGQPTQGLYRPNFA